MFADSLFDFELTSVALAKRYSWVSRRVIGSSAFKCMVAAVSHLLTFRSVLGCLMTAADQRAVSPGTGRVTGQPRAAPRSTWCGLLCQRWLGGKKGSFNPCCCKVLSELRTSFRKLLHPRSRFHPFPTRVRWQIPNLNLQNLSRKKGMNLSCIYLRLSYILIKILKNYVCVCIHICICIYR